MITDRTLEIAKDAAEDLRRRGQAERARAIESLILAATEEALPTLDFLTTTQAGAVVGVSGQTIKNWVREGHLAGFRVGGRVVIPREAVVDYVQGARESLDLDDVSDDDAARLVTEGRSTR